MSASEAASFDQFILFRPPPRPPSLNIFLDNGYTSERNAASYLWWRRSPPQETQWPHPKVSPSCPHWVPHSWPDRGVWHLVSALLITRIISVISVGDTLVEYYSTQNTCTSSGNQCVWPSPANTMTYPSLITFGAAVINLILSAIVLIAYVWGTAKADDWEDTRGMFEKACSALKITISSAAAGSMYSTGTSTSPSLSQSLWRISCNGTLQADTVLAQFIDFNAYCLEQVPSYDSSCY